MRRILTCAQLISVIVVMAATTFLAPGPAMAHTAFESSTPADGAVVEAPVDRIEVRFTAAAAPAGEGFVVRRPDGVVQAPDRIETTDDLVWTLLFDSELPDGTYGVRWQVAAPDTHQIEGSFSFTVTGGTSPPGVAANGADTPGTAGATEAELETFLEESPRSPRGSTVAAAVARVGRMVGGLGVVGGLVFLTFVLRGSVGDLRAVVYWVRRGGAVVVISALLAAVAHVVTSSAAWSGLWSPGSIGSALATSAGGAIGLRLLGGLLVLTLTGFGSQPVSVATDVSVGVRALAGVGGGSRRTTVPETAAGRIDAGRHRWSVEESAGAVAGAALIALSFAFDGHTVSEDPRWLHAIANVAHVVATGAWAAGVVFLALVLARRHRRGRPLDAAELAVRVSVIATIALVMAGLAGVALTAVILDAPSDLWSTPWGRLLAFKVALVAAAAAVGGYNHRVLVPALERDHEGTTVAERFRRVITVEAGLLTTIAITTAFLVAASVT